MCTTLVETPLHLWLQGGGGGSSAYHQALQARYGGDGSASSSGSAPSAARASGERSGSGASAAEAPTCSICLDKFEEGAQASCNLGCH